MQKIARAIDQKNGSSNCNPSDYVLTQKHHEIVSNKLYPLWNSNDTKWNGTGNRTGLDFVRDPAMPILTLFAQDGARGNATNLTVSTTLSCLEAPYLGAGRIMGSSWVWRVVAVVVVSAWTQFM